MWPRRQDTVSRPARKPTALCPVDGLCFAWVPSARARRHSREEESSLPVRPWSAVDPYFESTPTQVKQAFGESGATIRRHPVAQLHPSTAFRDAPDRKRYELPPDRPVPTAPGG